MDADHDELRTADERLLRAVRAASGPPPEPGAADSIADGAWKRASALRTRRLPRLRLLRPMFLALAASLLASAVVLWSVDRADPALAVEGDPVHVWKRGGWRSEKRVAPEEVVHVPTGGSRVLLFSNGSRLEPDGGAVFRVVRATGGRMELPFQVEVLRGTVHYDGSALAMRALDLDLIPEDADGAVQFTVFSTDAVPAPPASLDSLAALVADAEPRVAVSAGSISIRARSTGESLHLSGAQAAGLLRLGDDGNRTLHLTRLRAFSPTVLTDVIRGGLPVDAKASANGVAVFFAASTGEREVIEVSAGRQARVFAQLNQALELQQHMVWETSTTFGAGAGPGRGEAGLVIRVDVEDRPAQPMTRDSEYVFEKDGARTAVFLRVDGSCRLDRDGVVTDFPSLAALRRGAPDVALLFGNRLGR
jgi:hypothetical protein